MWHDPLNGPSNKALPATEQSRRLIWRSQSTLKSAHQYLEYALLLRTVLEVLPRREPAPPPDGQRADAD